MTIFDKFYTKLHVVKYVLRKSGLEQKLNQFNIIVDPSAGNGAFASVICPLLNQNQFYLCLDILPETLLADVSVPILKVNFFDFVWAQPLSFYDCYNTVGVSPEGSKGRAFPLERPELQKSNNFKILFITNPPFGERGKTAFEFMYYIENSFNPALGSVIGFILPLSFRKQSMLDRIRDNWFLVDSFPIPVNSFTEKGQSFSVKTGFFVFVKKAGPKNKAISLVSLEKELATLGVRFIKKPDTVSRNGRPGPGQGFVLGVVRVGFNAGKPKRDWNKCSVNSNYFLFIQDKKTYQNITRFLESHTFKQKHNTAGPASISKRELCIELLCLLKN